MCCKRLQYLLAPVRRRTINRSDESGERVITTMTAIGQHFKSLSEKCYHTQIHFITCTIFKK